MRQEVVDFYLEKKQIIHRIFDRRPKKEIPVSMVERGMERVYDRIQNGDKIDDIRVTHEAWLEAAKLFDAKWVEDNRKRPKIAYPANAMEAANVIDKLIRQHEDLEDLACCQYIALETKLRWYQARLFEVLFLAACGLILYL